MTPHRLFVGCVGQGVFRSLDHGANFQRSAPSTFVECSVRALAVDPSDGQTLYLGSEDGVFVSRDAAETWQQALVPPDREAVWSLAVSGQRIVAGTCPSRIFVSEDQGKTWLAGRTDMTTECPRIRHTRVTSILVNPDDANHLWAGVEIDGVHESRDGGRTWQRLQVPAGLPAAGHSLTSADIHDLALVPTGDGRRQLLATTNRDLNLSLDEGRTWRAGEIGRLFPWNYTRALQPVSGSPATLLLGTGTGPPGWEGRIGRSTDGGSTWSRAQMSGSANSTIWEFATHDTDPQLIYAASVSGEIYRSLDAGQSWERLPREFGEVRSLAWTPA